jgi:RHS repeat-associated protein
VLSSVNQFRAHIKTSFFDLLFKFSYLVLKGQRFFYIHLLHSLSPISASRIQLRISSGLIFTLLCLFNISAYAVNKSAARDSLIRLPSPGGTVSKESGNLEIAGNSGSIKFSLPLPSLPARAGVSPNIQLKYDLHSGDEGSGLGVGWGFDIPDISLSNRAGVLDLNDSKETDFSRMEYNGMRLVPYKDEDSNIPSYRLWASERDIRIYYHKSFYGVKHAHQVGSNPVGISSGFEVVNPNGVLYLFTADTKLAEHAGNLVTRYMLTFEVHPTGETIEYRYTKVRGRAYLSDIVFAGGQSRYQFHLAEQPEKQIRYRNGVGQSLNMLYTGVTASFGEDEHEKWCFVYQIGNYDPFANEDCQQIAIDDHNKLAFSATQHFGPTTQLKAIYRYGSRKPLTQATEQRPPIRFSYSSWGNDKNNRRDIVFRVPELARFQNFDPNDYELADINLDGIVDVLSRTVDGVTLLQYGTGSSSIEFGDMDEWRIASPISSYSPNLKSTKFQFADLNGDTFRDLLVLGDDKFDRFMGTRNTRFEWQKNGQQSDPEEVKLHPEMFTRGASQFVDINGDGRSDVISNSLGNYGETIWSLLINVTPGNSSTERPVFRRLEAPFPWKTSLVNPLTRSDIRIADMNADGLPDLTVLAPEYRGICVYPNTGKFFVESRSHMLFGDTSAQLDPKCRMSGYFLDLGFLPKRRSLDSIWYIDANGDGILDVASIGGGFDELLIWFNKGNFSVDSKPLRRSLNLPLFVGTEQKSRTRVADIDGDGASEILVFSSIADAGQNALVVDFNRKSEEGLVKQGLLTSVSYDSGLRYYFRYALSTDERIRSIKNNIETAALHYPTVVIKRVIESLDIDKMGTSRVTEFFYSDPQFDPIEQKFRGFSDVRTLVYGDENIGTSSSQGSLFVHEIYKAITENEEGRVLAGRLIKTEKYSVKPNFNLIDRLDTINQEIRSDPNYFSFSGYARSSTLPVSDLKLEANDFEWQAYRRQEGTWFISNLSTTETDYGDGTEFKKGKEQLHPAMIKTDREGFDKYNYPAKIIVTRQEVDTPISGLKIPELIEIQEFGYEKSRQQLKHLRILDSPAKTIITRGGVIVSDKHYSYNSTNGRVERITSSRYSRLTESKLPDAVRKNHSASMDTVTSYGYDKWGNQISEVDDFGLIETAVYDSLGIQPIEVTKEFPGPEEAKRKQRTIVHYGGTVRAGYVEHVISPTGVKTSYRYDSLGRLIRIFSDSGKERKIAYRIGAKAHPEMILLSIRRYRDEEEIPDGETHWIKRLSAYRPDGLQIAQAEMAGLKGGVRVLSRSQYNRNGAEILRMTPYVVNKLDKEEAAPSIGHLLHVNTACVGAFTGELCQVFVTGKLPRPPDAGTIEKFVYSPQGLLRTRVFPSGRLTEVKYYPWGTLNHTTYPDGKGGIQEISRLDITSTSGAHAILEYSTNSEPLLAHAYLFARDSVGSLYAISLPRKTSRHSRDLTYDSEGNLEFQQIPGAGQRYYSRDSRGRVKIESVLTDDGQLLHEVHRNYDHFDRITSVVVKSDSGQTMLSQYYYDFYIRGPPAVEYSNDAFVTNPLGEITQTTSYDENGYSNTVQHYAYNADGEEIFRSTDLNNKIYSEEYRVTLDGYASTITDYLGYRTVRQLDGSGRISKIIFGPVDNAGHILNPRSAIQSILYNPRGQIEKIQYSDTLRSEFEYDPKTLLVNGVKSWTNVSGDEQPLHDLQIKLNGVGSPVEILDKNHSSSAGFTDRSAQYQFNWKDELIQTGRYETDAQFRYTDSGVLIRNSDFSAQELLSTGNSSITPRSSNENPYSFNSLGQLKSSPVIQKARYDALGRLIWAKISSGSVEFGYDVNGNRTYSRQLVGQNESTSLFPFPGLLDENGTEERHLLVKGVRVARFEYGTGRWFNYLKDYLDSTDFLVAENGKPVEQHLYSSYGEKVTPAITADPFSKLNSDSPLKPSRFLYASKYHDQLTGLIYFGSRYYDPALGRFISPDPLFISDPGLCLQRIRECNLYSYARNNPVKFTDEDGNIAVLTIIAAVNVGMTVYDLVQTARVVADPKSTRAEVTKEILNTGQNFLPGGRYAKASIKGSKLAIKGIKTLSSKSKKIYGKIKSKFNRINTKATNKGPALSDSAWHKNAPHQVTPGIKSTTHQKYNPKTKQVETSRVKYDQYGRQVNRTDHTNHGYGDISKPKEYHSSPHTHTYEYGSGYGPKGKETRINQ